MANCINYLKVPNRNAGPARAKVQRLASVVRVEHFSVVLAPFRLVLLRLTVMSLRQLHLQLFVLFVPPRYQFCSLVQKILHVFREKPGELLGREIHCETPARCVGIFNNELFSQLCVWSRLAICYN